jgi:pyruvate kinase
MLSLAPGRRLAIMADLDDPKCASESSTRTRERRQGILSTYHERGDATRAWVSFSRLPKVVKTGDALYLNDGYIQLEVTSVAGDDVNCKVIVGGELRSRKGLNLPGIELGITAFTERDRECLEFALAQGVDAVSQSFVESGEDIDAVRKAAKMMGHSPFIFAKIERRAGFD